jgi:hypothetical protein
LMSRLTLLERSVMKVLELFKVHHQRYELSSMQIINVFMFCLPRLTFLKSRIVGISLAKMKVSHVVGTIRSISTVR